MALAIKKTAPTARPVADCQQEVIKLLELCCDGGGRSFGQAFDEWLKWAYALFTDGVKRITQPNQVSSECLKHKNAELYFKILDYVGEGLTTGDGTARCDFLGELYSSQELYNNKTGQFFTPFVLSDMCARLITGTPAKFSVFDRQCFNEPCVGAGALVLAGVNALRRQGANNLHYWWIVQDIDLRCVQMAYIQLSLLDIPALVVHGDTLRLDVWSVVPTFALVREPLTDNAISRLHYVYFN